MSNADDDAREARVSDYLEGTMAEDERRVFEAELAANPELRAQLESVRATRDALSGLHKMSAPDDFGRGVEQTIQSRSAGRFFGRKAFGDRVPFELVAVVALALLTAAFVLIRHLGADAGAPAPAPVTAPATREVIPRP
jgi:anti-sigma factor RsiW